MIEIDREKSFQNAKGLLYDLDSGIPLLD